MFLNNTYKIIQKIGDFACVLDKNGIIRAINAQLSKAAPLQNRNIVGESFGNALQLSNTNGLEKELYKTINEKLEKYHNDYSLVFNSNLEISLDCINDYIIVVIVCQKCNIEVINDADTQNTLKPLLEYVPAAIVMFDNFMQIISASDNWLERYSFNITDVLGKSCYDLFTDVSENWKEIFDRCLAGAVEKSESDLLPINKNQIEYIKWEIRPWRRLNGSIGGIIMFSEIITESEKKRKALQRLYRELNLLTTVGEIVIYGHDEFEMIENVCKSIINLGGYQLVWFGYAPDEQSSNQLVNPLHKLGMGIHYLDNFFIDLANPEHRKGPTARAILSKSIVMVNDFATDEQFAPWCKNAMNHNLLSSITLPIKLNDGKLGVICIYSQEKDSFSENEVSILSRLGGLIAYSLNNINRRYETKIAEIKQDWLIKNLNIRNKSLEDFTFLVSHNFRAKVANLVGISSTISDFRLSEVERLLMIQEIKTISNKLDEVIRDLNSTLLVKEHLMIHHEDIDLPELLSDVKNKLDIKFPGNNIIIITDLLGALSIQSDRYYLFETVYQMFQNLMQHDLKQGVKNITVKSKVKDSKVVLTFTDAGRKIELKEPDNGILEVYKRLYQHITMGGIKLFYVKALIETLGGELSVTCDPLSGVIFTILLPLN